MIKAVCTGDIIGSHQLENPTIWIEPFKFTLGKYGEEYGVHKEQFEVFQGDSFQIESDRPEKIGKLVLLLLSFFASQEDKGRSLRIRLGIGIGIVEYRAKNISESYGDAFIKSGHMLENLKRQNKILSIDTPWSTINEEQKVQCAFIKIIINDWTINSASAFYLKMFEKLNQTEMAQKLSISQPSVSKRIQGTHYEVLKMWAEHLEATIMKKLMSKK